MIYINKQRKKEEIRKIWWLHFKRRLSEIELEDFLERTIKSSKDTLFGLGSEALIENHINSSDTVYFSPKSLMRELNASLKALGDKFLDDTKFHEAYSASLLALAVKKINGDNHIIALSESPDLVVLKLPLEKIGATTGFKAKIEVLRCAPEFEKFTGHFNNDLVSYILKHKKSQDYQNSGLLIPLLTYRTKILYLKDFKEFYNEVSDKNKFKNVYLVEPLIDEINYFRFYIIYPTFNYIDFIWKEDNHLIY